VSAEPAPPDLRHVTTWLFDLDNTLYPAESGLLARMSPLITGYVARLTGLAEAEAFALQKRYLAEHGLTLTGLMRHHGVDPDDYHAMFHDVPLDILEPDSALRRALARLPGRRLVFTNADDVHARRVLEKLELADLFEAVFHIASADYRAKPDPDGLAAMVRGHAVVPRETCFFEDSAGNLAPAAALGMTTVLVGEEEGACAPAFVGYRARRLAPFLQGALIREDGR